MGAPVAAMAGVESNIGNRPFARSKFSCGICANKDARQRNIITVVIR